jgi:hypothetical protein
MRFWIAAVAMALVAPTFAVGQTPPSGQAQGGARNVANAKYVGVRACRACHRTEAQGSMFTIWERSKHAHAYDTLASARAREVGARLGVTNPQTDGKCLVCHVTAYGVPPARKHLRFEQSEGVGCEACHGAGELYKTKRTMCQITAGQVDPASVGLVVPNERTCVRCHNDKSPTWPGSFNYEQMQRQIAHPIPAARKQKDKTEGCGAAGAAAGEAEGE